MQQAHVTAHRGGFTLGTTDITRESDDAALGLDFAIVKQRAGDVVDEANAKESAWVLLSGTARVSCGSFEGELKRASLFDERPSVVHAAGGDRARIEAKGDVEWARVRATNAARFTSRVFLPSETTSEERGKGLVQDASLRIVRQTFDLQSRPESKLVVGEVVTLPGRWSSYPPHHHAQPELYHYRFDKPQGYGHAELGDDVIKVKHNDTVKILAGVDHPQVAAPGYAMWYLWIVRHQENAPYTGFTFTDEHKWILNGADAAWSPKELK
jgi:5-deoxy-glucuronate isomerase